MRIMDHAVLCYKLGGRGFDSRWCNCNFCIHITLSSVSVDCLEIWEPQRHGTLRASTGMTLALSIYINNLSLEIQPIFPYSCYVIICNDVCRPLQVFEGNTFKLTTLKSHRFQGNTNPLTPNVNYSGRTAPLTSKVAFYIFIQQI